MVRFRTVVKRAARKAAQISRYNIDVVEVGFLVDVLDDEGVWNPARIIAIEGDRVKVHYDGWGDNWDDWVEFSLDKVVPVHTYTTQVKCWVKIEDYPWWPGLATYRLPGNPDGEEFLREEKNLRIVLFDDQKPTRRTNGWLETNRIERYDYNFKKKKAGNHGERFENALKMAEFSVATIDMPAFSEGTLPKDFQKFMDASEGQLRQKYLDLTTEKWKQEFRSRMKISKHSEAIFASKELKSVQEVEEDSVSEAEDRESDAVPDESPDSSTASSSDEKPLKKRRTSRKACSYDTARAPTETTITSTTETKKKFQCIFNIGMRIDALDAEGIWCSATIKDVDKNHVQISYEGWGPDWDEWVHVSTTRIAPLHTYTSMYKGWAKLPGFPYWPCIINVRSPGNKKGELSLRQETRLYTEFLDFKDPKRRTRAWIEHHLVHGLLINYDSRVRQRNKKFKLALRLVNLSHCSPELPGFKHGTLPDDYDNRYKMQQEYLERYRLRLGPEQWKREFYKNIKKLHGYDGVMGKLPTATKSKERSISSPTNTSKNNSLSQNIGYSTNISTSSPKASVSNKRTRESKDKRSLVGKKKSQSSAKNSISMLNTDINPKLLNYKAGEVYDSEIETEKMNMKRSEIDVENEVDCGYTGRVYEGSYSNIRFSRSMYSIGSTVESDNEDISDDTVDNNNPSVTKRTCPILVNQSKKSLFSKAGTPFDSSKGNEEKMGLSHSNTNSKAEKEADSESDVTTADDKESDTRSSVQNTIVEDPEISNSKIIKMSTKLSPDKCFTIEYEKGKATCGCNTAILPESVFKKDTLQLSPTYQAKNKLHQPKTNGENQNSSMFPASKGLFVEKSIQIEYSMDPIIQSEDSREVEKDLTLD